MTDAKALYKADETSNVNAALNPTEFGVDERNCRPLSGNYTEKVTNFYVWLLRKVGALLKINLFLTDVHRVERNASERTRFPFSFT